MASVGLLSDTRMPTISRGGHGLARFALDIARALRERGHAVTLYAGNGSEYAGGELVIHDDEDARAGALQMDAHDWWIDFSHHHRVGQLHPHARVIHYIVDSECGYQPPNAVILNPRQWDKHPDATLIHMGVFVDEVPFSPDTERAQYSFVAKIADHKGYKIAWSLRSHLDAKLYFYGENLAGAVFPPSKYAEYCGEITDDGDLYAVLARSRALIAPSVMDMGSRCALQAALVGTPTIALDAPDSGMSHHVLSGISGYVCDYGDGDVDLKAVAAYAKDAAFLDAATMRAWAVEHFNIERTARELEAYARERLGV